MSNLDTIRNHDGSKTLRDILEWQKAHAEDEISMMRDAIKLSHDPALTRRLAVVGHAHAAVVAAVELALNPPTVEHTWRFAASVFEDDGQGRISPPLIQVHDRTTGSVYGPFADRKLANQFIRSVRHDTGDPDFEYTRNREFWRGAATPRP